MEHEYDFTLHLSRSEYERVINAIRISQHSLGSVGTWLRSELMEQMTAYGENPEPPKWPDYTGHSTDDQQEDADA